MTATITSKFSNSLWTGLIFFVFLISLLIGVIASLADTGYSISAVHQIRVTLVILIFLSSFFYLPCHNAVYKGYRKARCINITLPAKRKTHQRELQRNRTCGRSGKIQYLPGHRRQFYRHLQNMLKN